MYVSLPHGVLVNGPNVQLCSCHENIGQIDTVLSNLSEVHAWEYRTHDYVYLNPSLFVYVEK